MSSHDEQHLLMTIAHVLHAHVGKAHAAHQKMLEDAMAPFGEHHVEAMREYHRRHGGGKKDD